MAHSEPSYLQPEKWLHVHFSVFGKQGFSRRQVGIFLVQRSPLNSRLNSSLGDRRMQEVGATEWMCNLRKYSHDNGPPLHQQNDRFAVGRCGCCGCCGDSQQVSPTDIPPRPQHAHSSPARVHSTTEPQLRTTLPPRCGPCLNTRWSVFNLKTILLLAKHGNDNVDKGGDIHRIRE